MLLMNGRQLWTVRICNGNCENNAKLPLRKNGMGILIISHDERFVRDVSGQRLFIEKAE